jgi:hypothetical protein
MKIKKPSLKGMKNTKYLGHFAQDKYIQQGHNFSGSYPLFRQQSELEKAQASNVWSREGELANRQAMVDKEAAALRAQTPNYSPEIQRLQAMTGGTAAQKAMRAAALPVLQSQTLDQVMQDFYNSKKKFLTEI